MSAIEVAASHQPMKREVGRMMYHGALSTRATMFAAASSSK